MVLLDKSSALFYNTLTTQKQVAQKIHSKMIKQTTNFVLLGLVCLINCILLAASVNDESSLLAIKYRINSDSNVLARNWSQGTSFCTWIGITCSRRHPKVTSLDLFDMGLQGAIAPEIGSLSFLRYLDISSNTFGGLIPLEIGNLKRLRVLKMANNQLDGHIPFSFGWLINLERINLFGNHLIGTIPWSIFNLSNLQEMNFTKNQLSGTLPLDICHYLPKLEAIGLTGNQLGGDIFASLSTCSRLKKLYLSSNNFTGIIPMEIGNMSQLQIFAMARNKLTGKIPPTIGNLSNLSFLNMGSNSIQGRIPREMGRLSSLTGLNLEMNNLNGEIPETIFNISRKLVALSVAGNDLSGKLPLSIAQCLPNLERLYLAGNRFNGRIPNSIVNLSTLTVLSLAENFFSGYIPVTLGDLSQLQVLNVGNNQLTNDMSTPEQEFLTFLTNCKYLKVIQIDENPITGVLPKSLGSSNLSASLEIFLAGSCRLRGTILNEIGNLSSLFWLGLGKNDLTGVVPVTLSRLRNLQRLQIHDNKLQGFIESRVFCSLEKLYLVNLAGNKFSGQLPRCIGNVSSLRYIVLANNAFNSNIPSTLWFMKDIQLIDFSNNFFMGLLPQEIGNLKSIIECYLSGNQLSGGIPSTIGELQSLTYLTFSNNKLYGRIPESFANLKDLRYLDLSHNNLYGSIPKSMETLLTLFYFNVSFNELSGEIPGGGPFKNFIPEFFMGNRGLCGASKFKVEACKKNASKHSIKNILLKFVFPPIVSITVVAIVVILVLKRRGRNSSPADLSNLAFGLMQERISYYDILRATSNLDQGNLIGRGSFSSVYMGKFSDDTIAAVKIYNSEIQGAFKSFDTECQIMRGIRHRNLIKVITCCSNLDFKALVMAFMPNGNLDKWLYSPQLFLNIYQRLKIMIEVASAIEYLHQDYSSPIVHCDLKPSNILLDEEMVAHVGDFGIAKFLTGNQRIIQTETLGTTGYMAPEYGWAGFVSTKVDVYSYGILLIETFTRKKPSDDIFSGELTMKKWVSESFSFQSHELMKIVDAELLSSCDEECIGGKHERCLSSIMGLALECTKDLPDERPSIKDVVVRLNNINTQLHEKVLEK